MIGSRKIILELGRSIKTGWVRGLAAGDRFAVQRILQPMLSLPCTAKESWKKDLAFTHIFNVLKNGILNSK